MSTQGMQEQTKKALFFNGGENQDLFISMAVNTLCSAYSTVDNVANYPYVYLSIYKLIVAYE